MKHRITAPVRGYNGVSAGLSFVNGVAYADENCSLDRLNWFAHRGYTVEEVRYAVGKEAADTDPSEGLEELWKRVKEMKTKELADYGAELGLDLTGCTNNEQRREHIIGYLTHIAEHGVGSETYEPPADETASGAGEAEESEGSDAK